MTASAPPAKAARASAPCLPFGRVARSTPQWKVATTTSARRAARRTARLTQPRIGRRRARPSRPRDEPGGIDVREADEADPQPQPRDDSRPRRRGQLCGRPRRRSCRTASPSSACRAGPCAEVTAVVVGEVQHVHARVGGGLPQGRRAAAEVVLLVRHLLPARRDRAFEVPEGDVGATELTPTPLQGNRVPLTAITSATPSPRLMSPTASSVTARVLTRIDRDGAAPGATARNR